MKSVLLTLGAILVAASANAQGFDFNAIAKQVAASPIAQQAAASPMAQQAQQAVMQQALQQAAANPQLLTSMASSLTPTQQTTLMQKALTVGQQIYSPAEQASLTQFLATPQGQGIAAKLPLLVQQLAPTVLQMLAASPAAATAPAAGKIK